MDTKLVDSQAVDLLSNITGQKLSQEDVTPSVIFLAALVSLLLGVIFADSQVTEEEKQRLQKTLNKFIPAQGGVRELSKLLVNGVKENLDYTKSTNLLKLTSSFSNSQKLLLLSFGYEMSAADGTIDAREKRYLEVIADWLGVKSAHLTVLEAGFSRQENLNAAALSEVKSLLDPAQFHDLDTIFVKAANDILESLFPGSENQKPQQQQVTFETNTNEQAAVSAPSQTPETQQNRAIYSYKLADFNQYKRQLDNLCAELYNIIRDCSDRNLLPSTLKEEIVKISKKLQAQRFRLAVIGEFSQGKSTLLNALLREEIQPVRAIPCSGTITVLKYGTQKRVVCRYKDGREEEIPLEEYKAKASIPKEEARDHRSDQLQQSDITEIIFEHPDLELCRNGVEILDSPGLNEHPYRTAITQQLLKDTDAAIFLTSAMHLLPQKEQELIQDAKTQLNGGKDNEPAENLFILVNFMDLLDEEQDRQDVIQKLKSFVKQKNLLTSHENRIHYISAKAALKAILQKTNNEYLERFQNFIQSVETFLTIERGWIKINQATKKTSELIELSLNGLHQAEQIINGDINLSEAEKQKVWEQIGEASGRDVKIRNLANNMKKEALEKATASWDNWMKNLPERMAKKSEKWDSGGHSHIWSQDKLIQNYVDKFIREIQQGINDWGNDELGNSILKPKLIELGNEILKELESLQDNCKFLGRPTNDEMSLNLNLINIKGIDANFSGAGGFIGGFSLGSLGTMGLFFLSPLTIIPAILVGVGAGLIGAFGFGLVDVDGIHNKIKQKVCEIGLEKFKESQTEIVKQLEQVIFSAFSSRIEVVDTTIKHLISSYENLLEQQEKAHKETVEQREAEKAFIAQKRQELEQVQKEIAALLTQATA